MDGMRSTDSVEELDAVGAPAATLTLDEAVRLATSTLAA
jgi:hypothetical protein